MDETVIPELIDFSDPLGVLSLYIEHESSDRTSPQPTAPLELRQRITALTDELSDRDPDLARAVVARLKANDDDVAALLDPTASGIGRALFLGVDSGHATSLALQIPFRPRVVHHDLPYVRPLVTAYDEGRDAGILVVSEAGVRLLRWSVGEAEELESQQFEIREDVLGREMRGPSPANPADERQGSVHRERFEERIGEHRHRFLREAVHHVAETAKTRGWDRLVLAGSPKVRSAVRDMLPSMNGFQVIVADHSWEGTKPHEVAAQVWPLLRSVHRDRERRLIASARDRALSQGPGALGVRAVCDALNEGRVQHLLYDSEVELRGFRSEEGTLHADHHNEMEASDIVLHPEPYLVERMIETAFATDAGVTPVGSELAGELAEHDGVAAILRW